MKNLDRAGKYTIGISGVGKNGKFEGVYAMDRKYGLACSATIDKLQKHGDRIYVIAGAEDAQKYAQYLSRLYRYEFRHSAKRYSVSMNEFRIYPIKLTDRSFDKLEFEGEIKLVNAKQERAWSKKYQFIGDYENVGTILIKQENPTNEVVE
jgi:hypothetical protein